MSQNISQLHYSILSFFPNKDTKLTAGLAVHYPCNQYSHLYLVDIITQLKNQNNDFNPDFYAMILKAMAYMINCDFDSAHQKRFENIKSQTYLIEKTNYVTKEFQFSPVKSLIVINNNVQTLINDLINQFL